MKTELQQKLLNKYPQFFSTNIKIYTGEKPMIEELKELVKQKEMVLPIQFGFECGDGWYMLLDTLMDDIANHLKWKNEDREKKGGSPLIVQVNQIKEKFGGLSFYFSGGDEVIWGMITLAESLSYKICETCGTTLNVGRTRGWIYTCCKDCYDKNDRAKNMSWKPIGERFDEDNKNLN